MVHEPLSLPLLPLRDVIVFPRMIIPLFVGRDKSIQAIDKAIAEERKIFLVSQKEQDHVHPTQEDLYTVGVTANILQLLKLPDGTIKVLVEGDQRFHLDKFYEEDGCYYGKGTLLEETNASSEEVEGLRRLILNAFDAYAEANDKISQETLADLQATNDTAQMVDTVATYLNIKQEEKQKILEILDVTKRLEYVFSLIEAENAMIEVEHKIRSRVKGQMEKNQREYYLNEQLKAIHNELGDESEEDEFAEISKRIKKTKLSEEARKKAESELKKLKSMSPMASEATVIRSYLDWLLGLPWGLNKKTKINLKKAQEILDEDHDALEKIKETIIEHLAVQSRQKKPKGQILCLVGPPGVGKTSLATSIARATGRDFARAALGGVRDEAEIRGHRRTYIGSMPGRIIQSLKKAGSSNPVFLLDEIDKLGADWKGDPSSALLEVLDPAQNHAFNDHYLEVDFDLSNVMFIATANSLNMPQPLIDRLEVIQLSGYTEQEKQEIARHHLIPRVLKDNALKKNELSIDDEALLDIIRYYTRESGVRQLQRELNKIERKAVRRILEGAQEKTSKATNESIQISSNILTDYLGVRKYSFGIIEKEDLVGITTGLAWTQSGGDLLQIEAVITPGKGKVTMTGKLGDVMKESVQAAHTFIKFKAREFGIDPKKFEESDVHIHVPEGATPKDGPSAGITMCTSIVSAFTGIPVRKDIAMTGEVSLRGRVLPIGGLKEKLLSALRGGIKEVFIPIENEKDLADIPETIKGSLIIHPVEYVDKVIDKSLVLKPQPLVTTSPSVEKSLKIKNSLPKSNDGNKDNIEEHPLHS